MGQVYVCDRCGKAVKDQRLLNSVEFRKRNITSEAPNAAEKFDLCPECSGWFEGEFTTWNKIVKEVAKTASEVKQN